VGSPVQPVEDRVLPGADLVGQTAGHHPPDNTGRGGARIVHHGLARIGRAPTVGQRPVQGLDDVATLADAGQRLLEPWIQTPAAGPRLLGQPQPLEVAQASGQQRLARRIADGRRHNAIVIGHRPQLAVRRHQPFGLDVGAAMAAS
jgi:hypothetical protein